MAITEIPHSVRVEPAGHPDTTSMFVSSDGLKLLEPQGISYLRKGGNRERRFLLKTDESTTSVTYYPSEELDVLAFHPEKRQTTHYIARNGSYVEIGVLNDRGKMRTQYDIDNGAIILSEADMGVLPFFEIPQQLNLQKIEATINLLTTLKKPKSANPKDLSSASESILANINFHEPFQQQALFEI